MSMSMMRMRIRMHKLLDYVYMKQWYIMNSCLNANAVKCPFAVLCDLFSLPSSSVGRG